jgi:hypothetical protein
LSPYYQEYGIDSTTIPTGAGCNPFSAEAAELLAEFKPPVVSFHFGLPRPDLLAQVKAWGAKIFSSATTVAEARWLEAQGVDAIIAQGVEAGGHRGMFLPADLTTQVGTFALGSPNRTGIWCFRAVTHHNPCNDARHPAHNEPPGRDGPPFLVANIGVGKSVADAHGQ